MGDASAIEWTDATWNPVRGCVKVSPGCKHCYAETFAERWRGIPGHAYEQGFDPRLVPEKLGEPIRWQRPRRIFVNSMSDLFGEFVPFEYAAAVLGVIAAAQHHTFQILTKRAMRMWAFFEWLADREESPLDVLADAAGNHWSWPEAYPPWPLPNLVVGVSVEDRRYGLPRIDELRLVPAACRMLSIEPLLEDLGQLDLTGIGWVIVGGESGAGARPMREEWVLSIRDQCERADVPFFFKQWGGLNKKRAGRLLQGRTYDAFPEVRRAS